MTVKMYTRGYCPFCVRAKQLLDSLGVAYDEIAVDGDEARWQEMKTLSGRRTVPQIWIGDTHVGGCDDLMSLHRAGRLQPLLAESLRGPA